MRTTVTLEKDVERMLRDAMHGSRRSFKETLNGALRAGLGWKPAQSKRSAFVVRARSLRLRAGLDPAGFKKPADDLEVDAFLAKNPGASGRDYPDINLLLYAYDAGSASHAVASAWWQQCLSGEEPVGLAPVVGRRQAVSAGLKLSFEVLPDQRREGR